MRSQSFTYRPARRPARRGKILGYLFGGLFLVLFGGFWLGAMGFLLYVGTRDVLLQQRLLNEAVPVPAVITERGTIIRRGKNSTSWYPKVVFRYVVEEKSYESDRLTPLNYLTRRGRNGQSPTTYLEEKYPSNDVEARYLPSDPSLAYLEREAVGGCYAMTAGGIALATPLVWLLLNLKQTKTARDARGRLVLKPSRSLAKRKLDNGFIFLLAAIANGALIWHFFAVMPGPHSVWVWVGWAATLVMPLLALFGFVRAVFIAGAVSDATITLDDLKPGRSSAVLVEQDVLVIDTSIVEKVRVGVRCLKTTGSGKHAKIETVHENWTDHPPAFDRAGASATGARRLRVESVITLPSTAPVTVNNAHVTFAWTLLVRTVLSGKPDYAAEHIVEVNGW